LPRIELWRHAFAFPGKVAPLAQRAERLGYDGLLVADSQNLNADVWVELALAAGATERIRLGPGVTNPATRHPAVTASAAATLQAESGGRALLGMGRGDSALTQLGREPVHVAELEWALAAVQGYLSGGEVELDGSPTRIGWIASDGQPKVPLAVAATGPHVIEVAARHAERIDFTVGAEPERLRWAVDTARRAAGGRAISLGAYLNVAVDDDAASARDLVRGSTAIFARFAAEGAPPDGLSDVTRAGIEQLAASYDESRHGHADAPHARALEDDFIDRFAAVGDVAEVARRLAEVAALGIDHLIVVPGSLDADPAQNERTAERVAREVWPLLARG
jgi:5,10-methylenetetrahydromethanopterin reductase